LKGKAMQKRTVERNWRGEGEEKADQERRKCAHPSPQQRGGERLYLFMGSKKWNVIIGKPKVKKKTMKMF